MYTGPKTELAEQRHEWLGTQKDPLWIESVQRKCSHPEEQRPDKPHMQTAHQFAEGCYMTTAMEQKL